MPDLDPGDVLGPLAELIQRYPDLRQLSVRQAAARAGMSHEALNRIMAGKVRAPHAKTIETLGAGLGIPVRESREAVARNLEESYVVEDITTSVALQIAIARVGEQWQAMLAAAARFHDYSWRNVVLILAQRPDARQVAGYRTWQSLGRQVRKGEQGIAVIAPVTYRTATRPATRPARRPRPPSAGSGAGRSSTSSTRYPENLEAAGGVASRCRLRRGGQQMVTRDFGPPLPRGDGTIDQDPSAQTGRLAVPANDASRLGHEFATWPESSKSGQRTKFAMSAAVRSGCPSHGE